MQIDSIFKPRNVMLMVTGDCNLTCAYCYERGDAKYKSRRPMSLEIAEKALRLAASSGKAFHVQLTGGEPTLEQDLVLEIIKKTRAVSPESTISLQTNGTLLSRAFLGQLRTHRVKIGISLDGVPDVQESIRGRSAQTFQGMKLLREEGIPFNVTAVVSNRNVNKLKELPFVLGAFPNARGIGLDMLVRKGGALKNDTIDLPSPEELEHALQGLLKRLQFVNSVRSVPIHFREWDTLAKAMNRSSSQPFCEACSGESLAVSPSGELYPCTQTFGDPDFSLGTLDAPDSSRLDKLGKERIALSDCMGCPLEGRCPGDCPSRLYYNEPSARTLLCVMLRTLAKSVNLKNALHYEHL
ncbi:Radical SAM domain protein [Chloroherpeton thalassium ATCC 35110]|uniref:Radical SAM domain protein n=1 Tax=Chloroherpeton thalassium (strain ATCC 35110 / GB-78) TaxID=517418 RepID=B3QX85_CHLT3|nr:radical SAM protein [Chloroherpeton thalassium]ACF14895.1 Radical SAM domain protein [Chloroherpeton thalassium ATCC 35110]